MKYISRTVWILSLVSLLTDMASEMLYPVMPMFLQSIGFSIWMIGVLEGVAEATAGLSKGYFGKLSDYRGVRIPFVRWGYALSALSKPMMALLLQPFWILLARTTDRIGKGLRTGARDAMLSDETTAQHKAKVFGFHRSMDTLGAVLGPLLALLFLQWFPGRYRWLFLLAFLPGLFAVIATFLIHDKPVRHDPGPERPGVFSFLAYLKQSPVGYRRLVSGLLVFTLVNSSDVFLLWKASEAGLNDATIIGLYIFYNLSYAILAFPLGILADQLGMKRMLLTGLGVFVIVYAGMSLAHDFYHFLILFFLYGLYAAATEGISKAWISNLVGKQETATAIGNYTGFQSICTMLASSVTGWVWYTWGAATAFLLTAAVTTCVILYLALLNIQATTGGDHLAGNVRT